MACAQAVAIVSIVLFGLGIFHKVQLLVAGGARSVSILDVKWIPRAAVMPLLVLAGVIEVAVVGVLVTEPAVGLLAAAGLLLVYALLLHQQAADGDCQCFGSALPATNRLAIWRNAGLAFLSIAAAGVALGHVLRPHLLNQASLGVALIGLAVMAGLSYAGGRNAIAEKRGRVPAPR